MNFKNLATGLLATFSLMTVGTIQAQGPEVIGNISGDVSIRHGSASYSLPIMAPDSIHGLNPGVSVNYSQTGGASILGVGFALSASSSISRCTPNKRVDGFLAGIELTGNARFCHDGQRLVAINSENGGSNSEYRTYIDSNNKYVSVGGSNYTPQQWIQYSPDGYIYYYERQDQGNTLFANWLLVRKENQFGTGIDYIYSDDDVPVLSQINYPGYQMVFSYPSPGRAQALLQYQQGTPITSDKLLKSISVYSITAGSSAFLYSYQLDYEQVSGDRVTIDRLKSVTRCYNDDGVSDCLKPVVYGYEEQPDSRLALDLASDKTIVIPRNYYASDAAKNDIGFTYRPAFMPGDVNSDGYPDFCYYKPNTGIVCALHNGDSGGYGAVSAWSENLGYAASEDDYKFFSQLSMQDMNNDGNTDYCLSDDRGVRCGLSNGVNGFKAATYWTDNTDSSKLDISFDDSPQFQYVNADKLPDLCAVEVIDGAGSYRCYEGSDGAFTRSILGFSNEVNSSSSIDIPTFYYERNTKEGSETIETSKPKELTDILGDDGKLTVRLPAPKWIDLDGDMDLDICWLALNGDFNCKLRSTGAAPSYPQLYSAPLAQFHLDIPTAPANSGNAAYYDALVDYYEDLSSFTLALRYADLNGDGLVDLCYENGSNYNCRINTGAGFTAATSWLNIGDELHLARPGGLSDRDKESFEVLAKGTRASITLQDVNFDGLADFCAIYKEYQRCGYNNGNGGFDTVVARQSILSDIDIDNARSSGYANFVRKLFGAKTHYQFSMSGASHGRYLTVGDVNGDGHPDNCYRGIDGVLCVTDDNFMPPALLIRVTDSFGQVTDIEYGNLLGTGLYRKSSQAPTTETPAGYVESPPNRRVVKRLTTDSGAFDKSTGNPIRNTIEYSYQGYIVNRDLELGGFSAIEWRNESRGSKPDPNIIRRNTCKVQKRLFMNISTA